MTMVGSRTRSWVCSGVLAAGLLLPSGAWLGTAGVGFGAGAARAQGAVGAGLAR